MRALVKTRPAPGAALEQRPTPGLGPNDVLVNVDAASICGTDLHIYSWDPVMRKRIHPPLVFGHEFCGVVEKVGSEVEAIKPGQFVSAEMHVACGHCLQCRIGQQHICQNLRIIGIDLDGCFAEQVKIPASNILPIDPAIPRDYAALLDPLGNAGADVVLERSGNPQAIQQAFKMLRGGGRLSLLGLPAQPVELDLVPDLIFKGATVQGIFGRRMFDTWYRMLALLKAGALDLEPIISDRLPLERFEHAFDLLGQGQASKILLYPNGAPQ